MLELWRELQRYLTVETKASYNGGQLDRPVLLTFTIANAASVPSADGPEIVFEEATLHIRTESDGEVVKELGRLRPRESAVAEQPVAYRDVVGLTLRVEGRVSPEAFFTVTSQRGLEGDKVSMPKQGYIAVLGETDVHRWLQGTLKDFQKPGLDTTLGELKKQSQALSAAALEVRAAKERIEKLARLVSRGPTREAVIGHSTQVAVYLDEVERAIGQVRQVLESGQTGDAERTLRRLIPRLEQSAARLDMETQGLNAGSGSTARPVR